MVSIASDGTAERSAAPLRNCGEIFITILRWRFALRDSLALSSFRLFHANNVTSASTASPSVGFGGVFVPSLLSVRGFLRQAARPPPENGFSRAFLVNFI